jgi:hypothetical protein
MVDAYEMDSRADLEPTEYGVLLFDELPWPDRLCVLETVGRSLLCSTTRTISSSAVLDACVAAIFNQVLQEIDCEIEHSHEFPLQASHAWREMTCHAFAEAFQDELDGLVMDDVKAESTDTPTEIPEWLRDLDADEYSSEAIERGEFIEGEMQQWEGFTWEEVGEFGSSSDDEFPFDFDDDEEGPQIASIYENPPSAECTDIETWRDVIDALMDRVLADRDFDLAERVLDAPPSVAMELRRNLGIGEDYFVTPAPSARDTPMRLAAKLRRMAGVLH